MKKEKSLLEKALEIERKTSKPAYNEEQLDLVDAWLEGKLGISQVARVMKFSGTGNVYAFIAIGARIIYQKQGRTK